MVAVAGVDRADDREVVEQGGLFRQMLADPDSRQPRRNCGKRPAILWRPLGLHVPGIDVAGTAGHPQQDDALAVFRRAVTLRRVGSRTQHIGEREAGQSAQPGLEHAAPTREDQPVALARVEILERVTMSMLWLAGSGIHRQDRKAGVSAGASVATITDSTRERNGQQRRADKVDRGRLARSMRLGIFAYLCILSLVISHSAPIEFPMSVSPGPTPRIASMDQFRGYTVAGMFVVNFLSSFAVIHPVLKHNNTYFSYADSIMPSFLFAVGFSFRLTYLRRVAQAGYWPTVRTYVRRSLALVVVSLVMYGFGSEFKTWNQFSQMPPEFEPFRPKATRTQSFDELIREAREANPKADERAIVALASEIGAKLDDARTEDAVRVAGVEGSDFVGPASRRIQDWNDLSSNKKMLVHLRIAAGKLLKSDLWETLAIIGATQLVVLPFVGWSFLGRFTALVVLGAAHLLLSYWFNWDFLYGLNDNWLSKAWMTGQSRGWDGGFFGPLCLGDRHAGRHVGLRSCDRGTVADRRGGSAHRLGNCLHGRRVRNVVPESALRTIGSGTRGAPRADSSAAG